MTRVLVFVTAVAALWPAASPVAQEAARGLAQVEGTQHSGPRAYHMMCRREPALCAGDHAAGRRPGAGPTARLTPRRRRMLHRVNGQVNARIRAARDLDLYGVSDFWTAGRRTGDCEDYMIAKKQALLEAGWAADQLLYAVVEGTETPYHAVLIVRTDRGDLVLDNLRTRVVDWRASGYRFVVRQSAADPRQWVRVNEPAPRLAERGE